MTRYRVTVTVCAGLSSNLGNIYYEERTLCIRDRKELALNDARQALGQPFFWDLGPSASVQMQKGGIVIAVAVVPEEF